MTSNLLLHEPSSSVGFAATTLSLLHVNLLATVGPFWGKNGEEKEKETTV